MRNSRRPPVRFSHLKLIGRSPAHYKAAVSAEGYHIERGEAVHSLLLGGKKVTFYPGPVRRGKEWEAFKASHPNDLILTESECRKAEAMRDSARSEPAIREMLATSMYEQEIEWHWMGRDCLSHIDMIADNGSWIAELKTTKDSHPKRFLWQAIRMGWHAQLAFYDGAVKHKQKEPSEYYIIAIESSAPYPSQIYRLSRRMIDQGRAMCRTWMETLKVCEDSDWWPAYGDDVMDLDLPDEADGLIINDEEDDAA